MCGGWLLRAARAGFGWVGRKDGDNFKIEISFNTGLLRL